jgi:hypothetical protein
VGLTAMSVLGGFEAFAPRLVGGQEIEAWDPDKPFPVIGRALRVQPVFMYSLPTRKEAASWKSWGGVQSEAAVAEETGRISQGLNQLAAEAEFPLQFLPLAKVTSAEQAQKLGEQDYDVTLVYACTGRGETLRACLGLKKDALIFVRHDSGPVYYWYEALSVRYLQTGRTGTVAAESTERLNAHVEDVVVDDYAELRWRLRALFGIKNFIGTRIVALGGPWGKYAPDAPQKAQDRYQLKILEVSYEEFAPRLKRARADRALLEQAERWVDRYLALPHTSLLTDRRFVVNAFALYRAFKDLMREHDAPAFTIKSCMGTVIPMAETTACLSLGLLNDEGLIAFCESDFVVIPAGILLRYISGKPVFLHNSTFPHRRMVTCAHCTCPRRMDGRRYEPVKVLTHYESDYGAAPKVEIPIDQEVTFIDPEYSTTRWVGFKGTVKGNPSYEICRSQQDVEVQGNWQRLINEVRDSHWLMVYGDYLKEIGYAARKIGIEWVNISETV